MKTPALKATYVLNTERRTYHRNPPTAQCSITHSKHHLAIRDLLPPDNYRPCAFCYGQHFASRANRTARAAARSARIVLQQLGKGTALVTIFLSGYALGSTLGGL